MTLSSCINRTLRKQLDQTEQNMTIDANKLIATMKDALEDAEYQLSMFACYDKEDVDAHNAHAKTQGALKDWQQWKTANS